MIKKKKKDDSLKSQKILIPYTAISYVMDVQTVFYSRQLGTKLS